MKRFYRDARALAVEGGWQVHLDAREVKTAGGRPQIVPTAALADALAGEWAAQGETIDPAAFALRDLADYAIDIAGPDHDGVVADVLRYAETDTLCYRSEAGDALYRHQLARWDPLLAAAEARYDVRFVRASGVIHQPQSAETIARLRGALARLDPFTLAAVQTMASLAASLVIALAALDGECDIAALWSAANLEEEWQARLWGIDAEAEARLASRGTTFASAARFAVLAGASCGKVGTGFPQ